MEISVVIPTWNQEKVIVECLEALSKQLFPSMARKKGFEILVINDCSPDNTKEVLSKLKKKIKNLRVETNEKNLGLAKTVNKGIKQTNSPYVLLLHADCVIPDKDWLSKMYEKIRSDKKIGIVSSHYLLPKKGWEEYMDTWEKLTSFGEKNYKPAKKEKEVLCLSGGKADLIKREVFEKIGFFDAESFRVAGEDWDFSFRARRKGYKIIRLPVNVLHMHGKHNSGFLRNLKKAKQLSEANGVLFRKYGFLHNYKWNEPIKTTLFLGLAWPITRPISALVIFLEIVAFSIAVQKNVKMKKLIPILPFYRIIKDFYNITGFWNGFLRGKQRS